MQENTHDCRSRFCISSFGENPNMVTSIVNESIEQVDTITKSESIHDSNCAEWARKATKAGHYVTISERSLPIWKVLSSTSVPSLSRSEESLLDAGLHDGLLASWTARCLKFSCFSLWLLGCSVPGKYFQGLVKRSIEKRDFATYSMRRWKDAEYKTPKNEYSCDLEITLPRAADLHPLPVVKLCPQSGSSAPPPVRLTRRICERKREDELVDIRRQKAGLQDQKSLTIDVSFPLETHSSVMKAEHFRQIFDDNFGLINIIRWFATISQSAIFGLSLSKFSQTLIPQVPKPSHHTRLTQIFFVEMTVQQMTLR